MGAHGPFPFSFVLAVVGVSSWTMDVAALQGWRGSQTRERLVPGTMEPPYRPWAPHPDHEGGEKKDPVLLKLLFQLSVPAA